MTQEALLTILETERWAICPAIRSRGDLSTHCMARHSGILHSACWFHSINSGQRLLCLLRRTRSTRPHWYSRYPKQLDRRKSLICSRFPPCQILRAFVWALPECNLRYSLGLRPTFRRNSLAKLLALSMPTAIPIASIGKSDSRSSSLAFSRRKAR